MSMHPVSGNVITQLSMHVRKSGTYLSYRYILYNIFIVFLGPAVSKGEPFIMNPKSINVLHDELG